MPWSLEIHHLDISSAGDATIVRATDGTAQNTKIVLIDGGKTKAGAVIRDYCVAKNFARIDVALVTHFDKDHYYGVTWLLEHTALLDHAHIYDTGKLPNDRLYKESADRTKRRRLDSDYKKYRDAIGNEPNVRHATKLVNSFDIVEYDTGNGNVVTIPRPAVIGHLEPHWLIDKELMWGNGLDGMQGRGAFASVVPPGAPTITCIAANKYVRQHGGGIRFVSALDIYNGPNVMDEDEITNAENDNDNLKSLGFIIRFNNFKYYVAGDLEWVQEDGHDNRNTNPAVFQPGVRAYVNNADDMAGRVQAMKTSHHGSDTASTHTFIRQMRPLAAFISTGVGNQFKHPAQRTVNVLDGYPEYPVLSSPAHKYRHPPKPPEPHYRPIKYYLTGYQNVGVFPPLTYGGDSSETAGVPRRATRGHIRLEVSLAQSQRPVVGQVFRGIRAAADRTAQAAGVVGLALDAIADAGATLGTAYAVAAAIGAPAAAATQALNGAAYAGDDLDANSARRNGIITEAVAAAGGGKGAAALAASNVGGGRVASIGAGAAQAVGAAVTGQNALTISGDAQGAGATANEGDAAGAAALGVRSSGVLGADDEGYAACAAIRAVKGGATVPQAVAIALSIAATLGAAHTTAAITATMVTTAAHAAGMAQGLSAVAGAVASASWWEGVPAAVNTATATALTAAGLAGGAAAAGVSAQNDATIPAADLFNVHFTYDDVVNNQDANANVVHS